MLGIPRLVPLGFCAAIATIRHTGPVHGAVEHAIEGGADDPDWNISERFGQLDRISNDHWRGLSRYFYGHCNQ